MTPNELKTRFAELYDNMATSHDVSKMRHFGTAFSTMFDRVAVQHPDIAQSTLDFLAMLEYNNYVTPTEATEVASDFINDDTKVSGATEPSKGAHWDMATLKSFLMQKGLPLEESPFYNWATLWLTVNMIYSDFANAFVAITGKKDNDTIATSSYTFAVKKLKDRDRPHFIREYFELE